MKNRWLIGLATAAMAVTMAFGFVACGGDENEPDPTPGPGPGIEGETMTDSEIAKRAINTVKGLYGSTEVQTTGADYQVLGQTKVGGKTYTYDWSVSSTFEGYGNYVTVGELVGNYVTIGIKKATVEIEYTLKASVTVGEATESIEFLKKIPKGEERTEETVTKSLAFSMDTRTSTEAAKQVYEQNGITVTNLKGSGSDINSSYYGRFYKGSVVQIEFPGILHVDFHTHPGYDDSNYSEELQKSLLAAYPDAKIEVTDGETEDLVSFELGSATDVVEFTCTAQIRMDSIDVEGKAGGASAADKVKSAKSTLKLSQQNYFELDTIALPTEENGVSVSWALSGSSDYVNVSENKLNVTSLPDSGSAQATLTATLKLEEEQDTKDVTITLLPAPTLTNDGTAAHPYTAVEALTVTNLVDDDGYYSKSGAPRAVYVTGYVVNIGSWNSDFSNWNNVYIADSAASTKDSEDAIQIFRMVPNNVLAEGNLQLGAKITVVGFLQNYKGNTPEITFNGDTSVTASSYTPPTDDQQITNALAAVPETLTVSSTGVTTLPASSISAVTFSWALKAGNSMPEGSSFADGKITVTALPTEEKQVVFTVTATCGSATEQTKDVTVTIKPQGSEPVPGEGNGTKDSPFSVSQALEIINGLESYAYYTADGADPALVYIQGIVTVKGTSDTHGIKNYYIADAAGDTDNDVLIYSLNWSTAVALGTEVNVGDTILIQAYLQNYNGTPEITYWREGTSGSYTYHNGYIEGHTPAGGSVTPPGPGGDEDEESLIYTLVSTVKGANSNANDIGNYTISSPCTVDGILWDVLGNTNIGPSSPAVSNWRFGGKAANCNPADRTITGRGAIVGTVKSIKITFGATNGITVNSVTLKVYSTDPGTGTPSAIATKTVTWAENGSFTVTADDEGWTNCYYQLVMNLSTEETSNKWIVVDNIKFYGGTQPEPETDKDKVEAAEKALTLGKTTLTTVGESIDLPDVQGEANVTWKMEPATSDYVTLANGKLTVDNLPTDQSVTVKLIATLSVNNETTTKEFTITINKKIAIPQPENGLVLTGESVIGPADDNTGYESGTKQIDGYDIAYTDIANNNTIAVNSVFTPVGFTMLQFKKTSGKIELTGEFTKIVTVILSSHAYEANSMLTVQVGEETLTISTYSTEEIQIGSVTHYLYTVEYVVSGSGSQKVTFSDTNNFAIYVQSITLTKADSSEPQPETAQQKAQRALRDLEIPSTLEADFTMPESPVEGVELKFTAVNNSAIQIAEGGVKLTVTRSTTDVEGTVTVSATIDGVTETQEYDVKVLKQESVVEPGNVSGSYTIDSAAISDFEGIYKAYDWSKTDTNGTIGGAVYSYMGDGMQFNNSNNSHPAYIFSSEIAPAPISKVTIKSIGGDGQTDRNWKLYTSETPYFDKTVNPSTGIDHGAKATNSTTGAVWNVTEKDTKAYFFALVLDVASGASYIDSIVIEYSGTPVTDQIKVTAAKGGLVISTEEELTEDLTLPVTTLEGVTVTWSVENGGTAATIEGNKTLKITRQEDAVPFTLKATVQSGEVSEEKTFELTVKALPKAGEVEDSEFASLAFDSGVNGDDDSISSYDATWTATRGAYSWTLYGFSNNQKGWDYVKAGKKNNSDTATITTTAAISKVVTQVVVNISAVTSTHITSFKLIVSKTANFADDDIVETLSLSIAKGDNTFTISTPAAGYYYRLAIEYNNTTKSNGSVSLNKVTFIGHDAPAAAALATPAEVALLPSNKD